MAKQLGRLICAVENIDARWLTGMLVWILSQLIDFVDYPFSLFSPHLAVIDKSQHSALFIRNTRPDRRFLTIVQ
jgi:hypothetical protein